MRVDGKNNPFASGYSDQCTYWSQARYHALTNIWTPCTGNGYQWASQAAANGWIVTSQPPQNQPSIICLQPNVQSADRNFGHVGVVERINSDGSVYTSNYNVYPHIGDRVIVYLTFHAGNGVSFIFADRNIGSFSNVSQFANIAFSGMRSLGQTYALTSNPTVKETLRAMDDLLLLKNPFDIPSGFNPLDWLSALGNNIVSDLVSLMLRLILFTLGAFIIFKIISHFVDFAGMAQTIGDNASRLAPSGIARSILKAAV